MNWLFFHDLNLWLMEYVFGYISIRVCFVTICFTLKDGCSINFFIQFIDFGNTIYLSFNKRFVIIHESMTTLEY